jgi:NADH-quinone oxidoreductase subunit G
VNRHSVISTNHYLKKVVPPDPLDKVLNGRKPMLLMDINNVSEVNEPDIDLSILPGPATSTTFIEHDEEKEITETAAERLSINDHKKP